MDADRYAAIDGHFDSLWNDLRRIDTFPEVRPLLAHYTSVENLHNIVSNKEIWFSNPLCMNDIDEVRFGIHQGIKAFRLYLETIRAACKSNEKADELVRYFYKCVDRYESEQVFDLYALCLSEHAEHEVPDGKLSMWRGYGNNGNGVSIVFDTAKLEANEDSPLIIDRVHYGSKSVRQKWVEEKIKEFANLLDAINLESDEMSLPAHLLFERIKLFAIFSKHKGFEEEGEWRVVYMRERDTNRALEAMLSYSIGSRGLEPRLKLKLEPTRDITSDDFSLEKIVHKIVLGPCMSGAFAKASVVRMLNKLNMPALAAKVESSDIPYRAV